MRLNILWFHRDLRLHDNPAIHSALLNCQNFFAIYIFDTTRSGSTRSSYTLPRMLIRLIISALQESSYHYQRFILESLEDLDQSLQNISTRLHVFKGDPIAILRHLHSQFGINTLSFTCESEPTWQNRCKSVEGMGLKKTLFLLRIIQNGLPSALSFELGFHCIPHYTRTLWDPMDVITANGGKAPFTFETFMVCLFNYGSSVSPLTSCPFLLQSVVRAIGPPSLPVLDVDWQGVKFLNLTAFDDENFKVNSEFSCGSQ